MGGDAEAGGGKKRDRITSRAFQSKTSMLLKPIQTKLDNTLRQAFLDALLRMAAAPVTAALPPAVHRAAPAALMWLK